MNERQEALKDARPDRTEKKRVPLHKRNIISFPKEEGYQYRLINDVGGRVQKAIDGGWEHVESDQQIGDPIANKPKKIGKKVNMPVGGATHGYLMRIKDEWYKEDQAEKMKRVDSTEAATKPNASKHEYGEGLVTEKL